MTFAIDGVPVLPSASPRTNSTTGTPSNKSPRAVNKEVKVFSPPISINSASNDILNSPAIDDSLPNDENQNILSN